ncbi:MAG: hypothetical protein ABWX68_12805 [Arthrobacter sp.]|uniref:hypothetical protein n=1 Tax=Arthrobacter sp. TaxID=1667 RepID=UPI0034812CE1
MKPTTIAFDVDKTLSDMSPMAERFAGIQRDWEPEAAVEDAPSWKPGRAAYGYAAKACGTAPGESLLVAVHPWNVHGAVGTGLGTAWINRSGGKYRVYFRAPDHTVSGPDELTAALA